MIHSRLGSLNVDVFVTGATACHFGERVSVAVSESQVTAVPFAIKMVVGGCGSHTLGVCSMR